MTIHFGDSTSQTTAASPAGVVQTVSASTQTNYYFTSSTYADTNLSASITPTSSSNKILVKFGLCTQAYATNSTSLGLRILRGSSVIYTNDEYHWHSVNAAINLFYQSYMEYLDAPSTTSSTTYKLQGARYRVSNGTQQAQINPLSYQTSFIILQEVNP